jgi:hypothetical protein
MLDSVYLEIVPILKSFWKHLIVLLGDEAQVVLVLVRLEVLLILTQDRCTVCTEHTIGSKIIFGTPDRTPR